MSIQENINKEVVTAMKARDEARLRGLRAIKAALLLAGSEAGANGSVSDENALKIITKLAKQRKESLDIYTSNGRMDLAQKEQEELTVIESFLPALMSEDEIKADLQGLLSETGLSAASDFGKLMPQAMKRLAGKADGKLISSVLKSLLQ